MADAKISEGKLRAAIIDMDALSQSGFSEISAVARLALLSFENPESYQHPELVIQALRSIWGKADDIENCINGRAEEVGCNYIDLNDRRRSEALYAARQADKQKEVNHG